MLFSTSGNMSDVLSGTVETKMAIIVINVVDAS